MLPARLLCAHLRVHSDAFPAGNRPLAPAPCSGEVDSGVGRPHHLPLLGSISQPSTLPSLASALQLAPEVHPDPTSYPTVEQKLCPFMVATTHKNSCLGARLLPTTAAS